VIRISIILILMYFSCCIIIFHIYFFVSHEISNVGIFSPGYIFRVYFSGRNLCHDWQLQQLRPFDGPLNSSISTVVRRNLRNKNHDLHISFVCRSFDLLLGPGQIWSVSFFSSGNDDKHQFSDTLVYRHIVHLIWTLLKYRQFWYNFLLEWF
jgi:hypothetical protein